MAAIPSLRAPRAPRQAASDAHTAAQTRRILALAEKAELEAARMRGELIDRAKTVQLVTQLAQGDRDAVLAWPSRAAPILAAELGVDQHVLHEALVTSLRQHLTERSQIHLDV